MLEDTTISLIPNNSNTSQPNQLKRRPDFLSYLLIPPLSEVVAMIIQVCWRNSKPL